MKEVFDEKQGGKQSKSGAATAAVQCGIQARGCAVAGIGAEAGDTTSVNQGRKSGTGPQYFPSGQHSDDQLNKPGPTTNVLQQHDKHSCAPRSEPLTCCPE
jgi:hypothetical protein